MRDCPSLQAKYDWFASPWSEVLDTQLRSSPCYVFSFSAQSLAGTEFRLEQSTAFELAVLSFMAEIAAQRRNHQLHRNAEKCKRAPFSGSWVHGVM